jgi:signal transduction histidine kinase
MLSATTSDFMDLQHALQKLPVALMLFEGEKFILTVANDLALKIVPTPEREPLKRSLDQLFPASQIKKAICHKVFTNRNTFTERAIQIDHFTENSSGTAYFDFTYTPWLNSEGNCKGVIVSAVDVTDQVEAKNKFEEDKKILHDTASALKRSEERYQNYMSQSTEGIWRIELEKAVSVSLSVEDQIEYFYRYAYLAECNDAMAKMYGYEKAKDIVDKRLDEFLPRNKDSFEYLKYFIESGYRLEGTESIEKDRNGNTIYFLNNLVGVAQNGFVIRAWGSQIDISEKKKIEEQVKLAKEQLELTLQNIPSAVYLFDNIGQLKYLNDNAAKLYGNYTAEDLLKKNDLTTIMKIADDMYGRFDENDHVILPSQTPVGIALTTGVGSSRIIKIIQKQTGDVRWFSSQASPLFDDNGNISLVLGTATDITLQKQAEEKVRESELQQRNLNEKLELTVKDRTTELAELNGTLLIQNETFKQAEESSKQGSYSFNLSTGVLTYSDNLYKLLGFESGEFAPSLEEFNKHVYPDDRDYVTKAATEVVQTQQGADWRYRMITKTGEIIQILGTGKVIQFNNENILVGTLQDITQLVTSEELLKQKNLELQETIDQLRKREVKDEQKDNFIAMASHELKTPITSIKGYVQLLLQEFDGPESEKNLSPLLVRSSLINVDKQIVRLMRLISELLDLTKIEAGTLELKKENFSLNELCIEIVQDILYTNPNRQIELFHDVNAYVVADHDRIGQVMSNLLSNAIKYSSANNRIEVIIHNLNGKPAVSVRDYGIGIHEQDQERIFERFYRANGDSAQTYPGFGIGLFIVKEFIQRHEGDISVKSEKGKGSTFTFTLPVY